MAPIFSKNAILEGMVDRFCLVCEAYLRSESDTKAHIINWAHKKHMEDIQYVEEFKYDGIKKIKNKYFCELCNKLLTVLARVRLHISEKTHIDNKNVSSLKRVDNSIIAFEKVLICDQSWNGLNESSCALCNIEYENDVIHKNQSTHILNVIQIQVEFDNDQNIYRRIDEVSFHCLTCNMVLGLNSLTSHFAGGEHKKLYQACCIAYNKKPDDKTPKEQVTNNDPVLLHSEKKSHEIVKPQTIIKECIENDLILEKPQNVKEDAQIESAPIDNNQKVSNKTKKTKENNIKVKYIYDENEEDKICKTLRCKDYITLDEHQKTWCILCDWIMVSANIISHVNGKHHQTMLKLHKARLQIMKNNDLCDNHAEDTQNEESDKIFEKFNELQKDDIIVNSESNTVFCKKCNIHIEFVYGTIESHILEHKKKSVNKKSKPNDFASSKESVIKKSSHNNDDNDNEESNKRSKNNDAILENLNEFQNHDIKVNFESSTAFCKKCNTLIEFVYKAIESHILEHNKPKPVTKASKTKVFDSLPKQVTDTKSLFTSPVFLKRNDENDDGNKKETPGNTNDDKIGSKGCVSVKTSKILEALSSRNDGDNISKNAETKSTGVLQVLSPKIKKPKTVSLTKVPLKVFIHSLVAMEHMMYKDVIINDKYCINFICFCFLLKMGPDLFRCQVCQEYFQVNQFERHCELPLHTKTMVECPVIVNDDTEFIREIHPGSFLCGFCNWVEASWESMEGHLKSSAHKECKSSATWRKEMYQPRTERDDIERIISDNIVMDALINRFF